MKNVGFVGWRGMIGSILIKRMIDEDNFNHIDPFFFSTSQKDKITLLSKIKNYNGILYNAWDLCKLCKMDIIISCYGSNYTKTIYHQLRNLGWNGYWIDTSSALRMQEDTIIALDPINNADIIKGLNSGIKNFVCANCTVNLMLMSLKGLFINNLIEKVFISTYQAVSGGGSKYISKLLFHINYIFSNIKNLFINVLDLEYIITKLTRKIIKREKIDNTLAFNIIPWIDEDNLNGQSKEEWKIQVETNKILNMLYPIKIDSLCVRVNTLRCHGQSFLIKLKKDLSLKDIEQIIINNEWVDFVPNNKSMSIKKLTPISVNNTLKLSVGRLRKLRFGSKYISVFSIGDQLLWGGVEPVRRMLVKIINFN